MRTIQLQGKLKAVINRNKFEATYLFEDAECGEILLSVPRKMTALYKSMDREKYFNLLAKVEGISYKKSLGQQTWYKTKIVAIKQIR